MASSSQMTSQVSRDEVLKYLSNRARQEQIRLQKSSRSNEDQVKKINGLVVSCPESTFIVNNVLIMICLSRELLKWCMVMPDWAWRSLSIFPSSLLLQRNCNMVWSHCPTSVMLNSSKSSLWMAIKHWLSFGDLKPV